MSGPIPRQARSDVVNAGSSSSLSSQGVKPEDSIFHQISEVLDVAMGVKKPEDLQRYLNFFLGSLVVLTLFLIWSFPEQRALLGGFLMLLLGLFSSVVWVLAEAKRASESVRSD